MPMMGLSAPLKEHFTKQDDLQRLITEITSHIRFANVVGPQLKRDGENHTFVYEPQHLAPIDYTRLSESDWSALIPGLERIYAACKEHDIAIEVSGFPGLANSENGEFTITLSGEKEHSESSPSPATIQRDASEYLAHAI